MPAKAPLNRPTPENIAKAEKILLRIRDRLRNAKIAGYDGYEFENDIQRMLQEFLPHSVLSGVRLFAPSNIANDDRDFACEVDLMLHLTIDGTDHLILIECKNQPVPVEGKSWVVEYGGTKKDVKYQLINHVIALRQYLLPFAPKIKYFVVSNQSSRKKEAIIGSVDAKNADFHLIGFDQLLGELTRILDSGQDAQFPSEAKRVSQSRLLDLLRLGFANTHLGHPEITAAIRYVDLCRRNLDVGLFDHFKPYSGCWLINGSAGMGKSVLLAYSAFVISCRHMPYRDPSGAFDLKDASKLLEETGLTEAQKNVVIAAHSMKQLDSLKYWYGQFLDDYQDTITGRNVHFVRPEFKLFSELGDLLISGIHWNAVLLDEAHDLPNDAVAHLERAHEKLGFYLIAACDRHQQIRNAGERAKVIPGKRFSFIGKHKRLRQIYHNPAPIYIASLALMFRWFSPSGLKMLPTDKDLKDNFGFDVSTLAGQSTYLKIKNDAHPANRWNHTVSCYHDAATVAAILRRERLRKSEVLWVRFDEEDPTFDYESLQNDFIYHNCHTSEAPRLNDKYIKGQEYPVVIIEGFQNRMNKGSVNSANESDLREMFRFRRELYLCASRATCFLFFIDTGVDESISEEISALVSALSTSHEDPDAPNGTKIWSLRLKRSSSDILPDEYAELVSSAEKDPLDEMKDALNTKATIHAEPEPEPEPSSEAPDHNCTEVAIAEDYVWWPPPPERIPAYTDVLQPILEPPTVEEFAEILETDVDELLDRLKKRGRDYSAKSLISLPIMRSLAFEFKCYPPASQEEFESLAEQEAESEDCHESTVASKSATTNPQAKDSAKSAPPTKPMLPPDSRIETAKRNALDLFAEDPKKKKKPKERYSTHVPFGSFSKIVGNQSPRMPEPKEPIPVTPLEVIQMNPPIILSDLASRLGLKPFKIMADLIKMGMFPAPNQPLELPIARQICELHGFRLELKGGDSGFHL